MDQAEQLRELVKTIENGKQKSELNIKNSQ